MTAGKATILAVDDEEHVRKLLRRILEEAEHNVLMIANGREGLEELSHASISLVLLDIRMPAIDDFQMLEFLRQN